MILFVSSFFSSGKKGRGRGEEEEEGEGERGREAAMAWEFSARFLG